MQMETIDENELHRAWSDQINIWATEWNLRTSIYKIQIHIWLSVWDNASIYEP